MQFHIRPGNVTCAGVVAIYLVMQQRIWKGSDARVAPTSPKIETAKTRQSDTEGRRVKIGAAVR